MVVVAKNVGMTTCRGVHTYRAAATLLALLHKSQVAATTRSSRLFPSFCEASTISDTTLLEDSLTESIRNLGVHNKRATDNTKRRCAS